MMGMRRQNIGDPPVGEGSILYQVYARIWAKRTGLFIFSLFNVLFGLQPIQCLAGNVQFPMQLSRSVVKVTAMNSEYKLSVGSGVVIAKDQVVTNCHITRIGERILISKAGMVFQVKYQAALPLLDICILKTRPLPFPQAKLTEYSSEIAMPVVMIGFPLALKIRMMRGKLVSKYQFMAGDIIEVDSAFTHGASGGGVFNQRGELIGLMTFMTRNENDQRFFVSPAMWIKQVQEIEFKPLQPFIQPSYWETGLFSPP